MSSTAKRDVRDVNVRDVRDVRGVRDVNVLKKTKDLMLITSLNPTSLWCFSPDPIIVGVANFGQIQKIRFVVVKIFRSNSNQFLVILIRSSKLASK